MSDNTTVIDGLPAADYANAGEVSRLLAPSEPLHLLRPKMIYARTMAFQAEFADGLIAYAVRANPEPKVLENLFSAGVDWYACDTLSEIESVQRLLPDARLLFMHPVKSEQAIETAYKKHRVRSFVIDHPDELRKIKAHTGNDATLIVRIAGPPGALLSEGYRFGCSVPEAVSLCHAVVDAGYKLGLSFHLGSQVMDPDMYDEAFLLIREVMYRARYMLDCVSVGGGFPAIYDNMWPEPLPNYMRVIKRGLAKLHLPNSCHVFVTPGRALVADSVAILAKVEQRRGQTLYINDGQMGALGSVNVRWWRPPVRLVRPSGPIKGRLMPYRFSGAACYGNDLLPGPFFLPADTRAGDYIELGQMGAYCGSIFTAFHSLPWPEMVTVADDPPIPLKEGVLPFEMSVDDLMDEMGGYDTASLPDVFEEDDTEDHIDPHTLAEPAPPPKPARRPPPPSVADVDDTEDDIDPAAPEGLIESFDDPTDFNMDDITDTEPDPYKSGKRRR